MLIRWIFSKTTLVNKKIYCPQSITEAFQRLCRGRTSLWPGLKARPVIFDLLQYGHSLLYCFWGLVPDSRTLNETRGLNGREQKFSWKMVENAFELGYYFCISRKILSTRSFYFLLCLSSTRAWAQFGLRKRGSANLYLKDKPKLRIRKSFHLKIATLST